MDLNSCLDAIQVSQVCDYHDGSVTISDAWFAVSDSDGVCAYFASESGACCGWLTLC